MNNQAAKLLIYAISRADSAVRISNLPTEIETQIVGNFVVFFAQVAEISHDVAALKKYHDIISGLHSEITIIPFRYNSGVENLNNLQTWLENEMENYAELLAKLEGLTEMSLRIIIPPLEQEESAKPLSGKDYLLKKSKEYQQNEKVSAIIELLKTELQKYICELKNEKHGEILSVYFLIKNDDVENFRQKFAEIEKKIGFNCVLTGGWCPFNFCTNDV